MSGQGNIKMINATELDLDYELTVIPRGGNDYPLKNGTWETRNCPYSSGVGIVTSVRTPWIRQGNGVPTQLSDGDHFDDADVLHAYLTKHPSNNDTIIVWSTIGRMVDPESGHDVMAGDPNYLLCAGAQLIGGKFVYSAAIQNMCSWQHQKPFSWGAEYGASLPNFGTNWQEVDPLARVGCFLWDDTSGHFHFKGGFQGDTVDASIYAAIRFNPPTYSQNQTVGPSGTEYDALPIEANGRAFNLGLDVGMKGHSAGLKLATVVAYVTSGTPRANKGWTDLYGWY